MKTHFTRQVAASLCLLSLALTGASAQTTWIANANPGAPTGTNVFLGVTAINDAIAAASNGDVIYVVPSSTLYNTVTVSKSVSIFGGGFFPQDPGKPVAKINGVALAASNSRISGVHIAGNLTSSAASIGNIMIDRCRVTSVAIGSSVNAIGSLVLQNCIVGEGYGSNPILLNINVTNAQIANNIVYFNCSGCSISEVSGATIENNVFVAPVSGGTFTAFDDVSLSSIRNNIFFGVRPIGSGSDFTNNVFTHNISFNSADDAFPTTGHTLSDNIAGQDPLFVSMAHSATFLRSYDLNLQATSPAKGTGVDGGDMGVFGGVVPFDIHGSALPAIQSVSAPNVVGEGSDLTVRIRATGN